MGKRLLIFGAGGFSKEVAWLIHDINQTLNSDERWNICGFTEYSNERIGQMLNGIPIISLENSDLDFANTYAIISIGDSKIRERAAAQAERLNLKLATLVHPSVKYDKETVRIGEGSIICAGTILTVNVTIGRNVIINLDATVGHDCVIEEFVTISPGCHLSGYTTVRHGAYLGTGMATIEGHEIGEYAIVGAGAVVVNNIPANSTAVGVPAKVIKAS